MPALVETGSENRRPRRSSLTQQFQRLFQKDRAVDARHDSHEDPLSTDASASTTPRPREDSGSFDYSTYGTSEISSTRHSRHSSLQSFQLEPQQPVMATVTIDSPVQKHGIDRLPAANHSIVEKKDRRATKRLEAERLELEKRLLKLEEAERTGDVSVLRRESRRLIKKQPLGSSNRSSSMSDDDEQAPSRLTSIFSSARRRSRSRSKSVDGAKNIFPAADVEESAADNSSALPALSSALPERLSTAISKELAARKDALLASPEQSSQSVKLSQLRAEPATNDPNHSSMEHKQELAPFALGAFPNGDMPKTEHPNLQAPNVREPLQQEQADLDRALFTASLTSRKRGMTLSQPEDTSKPIRTTIQHGGSDINLSMSQRPADDHQAEIFSKHRSNGAQRIGSPRGTMARASTEGVVQRQSKKFKSSPLAETYTVGDDVSPAPQKTPILASAQISETPISKTLPVTSKAARSELSVASSPGELQTLTNDSGKRASGPFSDNLVKHSVMETQDARTFLSRIPTSKHSQSAPREPLTKPRFYNSLNKVTGSNGGKPKAIGTLSPRRERDTSPPVPPKSPKRNSLTLSRSPDRSNDRPRPTSPLSTGMSAGSDSDYNTADETASIISRISESKDRPTTARIHAAKTLRVAAKQVGSSSLTGASVPVGFSNPKVDSKKATKKSRQTGREQLVAKLFVICCRCKFWHDMPSEMYARLTVSDPLSAALDEELIAWEHNALSSRLAASDADVQNSQDLSKMPPALDAQQKSLRTRMTTNLISGPVRCCWCEHSMSKQCCQGWTTVVQMRQRHH